MDEPSPSLKVCSVCGGDRFTMNQFYDEAGILLYWSAQTDVAENLWPRLNRGRNVLRSRISPRVLNQGKYRLELIVLFIIGNV
jgi:hypothetical protein